jgi:hypothetical protein
MMDTWLRMQDVDGHDKSRSKRSMPSEAAFTPAPAPTPVVPLRAPDVTPMITASRATTPGLTLATSAGANDQLLAKVRRIVVCKTQSVVGPMQTACRDRGFTPLTKFLSERPQRLLEYRALPQSL